MTQFSTVLIVSSTFLTIETEGPLTPKDQTLLGLREKEYHKFTPGVYTNLNSSIATDVT
jgi:hypothetical protein